MSLGVIILAMIVLIISLIILGVLIAVFILWKRRKNELNHLRNSLSEGVSKKQIK